MNYKGRGPVSPWAQLVNGTHLGKSRLGGLHPKQCQLKKQEGGVRHERRWVMRFLLALTATLGLRKIKRLASSWPQEGITTDLLRSSFWARHLHKFATDHRLEGMGARAGPASSAAVKLRRPSLGSPLNKKHTGTWVYLVLGTAFDGFFSGYQLKPTILGFPGVSMRAHSPCI